MAFTQITVTGTYQDATGAPLSGSVTFRLSTSMHDAAGGIVRAAEPVVATLDGSGRLSVSLAANDDPTTTPTGVTYAVEERLTGADGTVTSDYSVVVPHTAVGGTVLITELAPVTNQSVTYGVLSVDGKTGAVTTDPDLLTIAALDSTVAGALATDGAGWIRKTYAAFKTALALVKADVGLGNVDNTADVNKPVSTAQAAADALKVSKTGDTMSGDLAMGTNRVTGLADPALAQDAATRAYVLAQIAALVNSAPAILDTLGEIATQLQSDESTATALTTTVAGKLAKASNLSDLASAATARTNLGLGSIATHPTSDFLTPAQGNGSYAALAGGNTITESQTIKHGYLILDRSTEGFASAPEQHFLGANGGAYIGIDVANAPYSRDWVLYGKPGTYGFTDAATTSGSPLITSAAYANFTSTQVGLPITGAGIPAATTVARLPSTTVAVGSNGAVLPQGTINVADTTDFASAGTLYIDSASARSIITYTGKTGTTFTGCTGGTATLATGNTVSTTTQAVLSANATVTATGVALVITDTGVYDQFYCSHRGGASPTFGFGVTPPSGNYRLQVSPVDSEPLMGGLYIRIGPNQKTKTFTIGDSGGTDRVTIDQQGVVVGNTIAWGEGLTVQALPTGSANTALRLVDKTGTATTMLFYWSGSFVNIKAGGRDIFTIDASGNLQIKGGFLSFFGASASVGRQTISGAKGGNAALASLLTALASLGLITDSTSA